MIEPQLPLTAHASLTHAHGARSPRARTTSHLHPGRGERHDAPRSDTAGTGPHATAAALGVATPAGAAATAIVQAMPGAVLAELRRDDGRTGFLLAGVLAVTLLFARARTRAVRALATSEARLRAIFDHAAVGIVVQGEDGKIQDANPAFQQIVRYSLDELRAMRTSDFAPPQDARAVDELPALALAIGGGERVTVEQRFRRRDGALRR
ncbi:MAG TPA: PAS domain S-box protein, partial [Gemmatirosa sp.]